MHSCKVFSAPFQPEHPLEAVGLILPGALGAVSSMQSSLPLQLSRTIMHKIPR